MHRRDHGRLADAVGGDEELRTRARCDGGAVEGGAESD